MCKGVRTILQVLTCHKSALTKLMISCVTLVPTVQHHTNLVPIFFDPSLEAPSSDDSPPKVASLWHFAEKLATNYERSSSHKFPTSTPFYQRLVISACYSKLIVPEMFCLLKESFQTQVVSYYRISTPNIYISLQDVPN